MYSALWTVACAAMMYTLQLLGWTRTGTWTSIAISDVLRIAGILPPPHYSTASAVERDDGWLYELFIYWISEIPFVAIVLIVAGLLFFSSLWIASYEKGLRSPGLARGISPTIKVQ